jgi:hypothetical protein
VLTVGALTASAATMTPPTLPGPDVTESYLGRFAIGYTEGGIKFVKGTADSIAWVLSKIPEIPTMTEQASIAFVNVGSRLVNGLVSVGTELYQMTLAERAAFAYGLAQDAMNFVLVKAPNATGAMFDAILTFTNQVVEKLISAALYDPDPGAFWQGLGSFTSQAIGEISVGWLTDAAVAKVLVGLKDARGFVRAEQFLSEQAKAVGLKLEKGLAGILPGTLITDRMLALGMGITRAQKDYMIAVARKWGVNIYARSRGARAIELIEQGLATVKPYFIKPKSVNDIDKIFLGFEKLESDVVAMRRPNSWEQVSAKMDSFVDPATGAPLTADQRNLVVDRWQKRNKEWFGDKGTPGQNPVASDANYLQSDRYKLQQKSGKVQNLTLETEGNLEDAYEGKAFQVKPTKFQLVASAADPEALVPQLFEGTWKSIVGDIDLVAITLPNGRVPDVETLIKIYQDLQLPPLDMQHSATLTWLNQGAATSMLKDHLGAAAEPLIEASVSSRLRAVLFDPQMSFENGDYFKKGAQFVHLAGGEINAPRAWGIGGAITVVATDIAHKDYAPPSVFPADMGRTAPPTRIGPTGLETLVNGVWVPSSAAPPLAFQATVRRAPEALNLAAQLVVGVQTAVTATVPAGTTALPILSLAQLYPAGSVGQGWFRPGDKVIIDPGTESAFSTTLVSVGDQLVLADPLPAEVLMGTMVAMVPEVAAYPPPPSLPNTGANLWPELEVSLALVVLGLALTLIAGARRRRPCRAQPMSALTREQLEEQALGVTAQRVAVHEAAAEVTLAALLALDPRLDHQLSVHRRDRSVVHVQVRRACHLPPAEIAQVAQHLVEQQWQRAAVHRAVPAEVVLGEPHPPDHVVVGDLGVNGGRQERVAATGQVAASAGDEVQLVTPIRTKELAQLGDAPTHRLEHVRRWVGAADQVLQLAHRFDVRPELGATVPAQRWPGVPRIGCRRVGHPPTLSRRGPPGQHAGWTRR